MGFARIDTRPRIQKSDKAELKLRCKPFRGWLNGRKCRVLGLKDHVCRGPVRACHVDYAGGKGTSIKVSDRFCIPMCDEAHREQTDDLGWPDFDEKYGINALQDSRAFWRLWPSRAVWCAAHPEFEV
jgi:hypothetical protein